VLDQYDYDVFLSYRQASDINLVELLYSKLVQLQVRVREPQVIVAGESS